MTTRQINLVLWISAATLCAAIVTVAGIGLVAPLESSASSARPPGTSSTLATAAGGMHQALPPLESFAGVWSKSLRRPLADTAPSESAPAAALTAPSGAAPPPIILVGTIGTSLAMLKTPDGLTVTKGVGDQIAGAEVIAIRPSHVDIRYIGKTFTLDKAVSPAE